MGGDLPHVRPAVFLDRDGVLNARRLALVRRPEQVKILPGVGEAAARLTRAGFALVIASNQEFVSQPWFKGTYILREHHEAIMDAVVAGLEAEGGAVDGVYACTHRRGAGCDDAKPKPGMLKAAARELGLDLPASFMVGDNAKDVLAGRRAGCRTVLVDPRLRTRLERAERYASFVARDLPQAAEWILRQKPPRAVSAGLD